MEQKLVQKFLPQEAGAFWYNIEKESQKSRPKLEKYLFYILIDNICSAWNPVQVTVLCKNGLIL